MIGSSKTLTKLVFFCFFFVVFFVHSIMSLRKWQSTITQHSRLSSRPQQRQRPASNRQSLNRRRPTRPMRATTIRWPSGASRWVFPHPSPRLTMQRLRQSNVPKRRPVQLQRQRQRRQLPSTSIWLTFLTTVIPSIPTSTFSSASVPAITSLALWSRPLKS